MFCYQCEQAAKGTGCTTAGVCGKNEATANNQDELTCALMDLAVAAQKSGTLPLDAVDAIVDGLFVTVTNVNFDPESVATYTKSAVDKTKALGGHSVSNAQHLFKGETDEVSLRSTLLFGLRGMAAYAHHARVLGRRDQTVDTWFVKGMAALTQSHTVEEWLSLLMEFGHANLTCMAILDEANTGTYGQPTPTTVSMTIEPGPFIVISGHDLHDLQQLLVQTDGTGVNVYTHSEMLPAHAYPALKQHPQLKGNFGTAWQTQQKEFDGIPAPILFTTNCLMPPRSSYADRVYTTSVMGYPGLRHIGEREGHVKDFTPVIEQAIALGGYAQASTMTGINGGTLVTTGFGRQTVLDNAGAIIDAVKSGAIRHFFLVGGCDGAKPGRNYYTEFVKQTPQDSVVMTLACGKYRFNDMQIGQIGPFPRILDMGQCNDAYGAVQVAMALAGAFDCGVNDLPLTLVLSWYEQKAVCILLTLLSLGIRNIYIGPSLPAFFSSNVLDVLVKHFELHPITTPEADLAAILS